MDAFGFSFHHFLKASSRVFSKLVCFRFKSPDLFFKSECRFCSPSLIQEMGRGWDGIGEVRVKSRFVGTVVKCKQTIIVSLRYRVIFMIMTPGTFNGQSLERLMPLFSIGLHCIRREILRSCSHLHLFADGFGGMRLQEQFPDLYSS
jgi:hypothetical protein